jgi:hypothetical protein
LVSIPFAFFVPFLLKYASITQFFLPIYFEIHFMGSFWWWRSLKTCCYVKHSTRHVTQYKDGGDGPQTDEYLRCGGGGGSHSALIARLPSLYSLLHSPGEQ